MPPTVRPAVPGDLPMLGHLGALLVQQHHELDPDRFLPVTAQTERGYAAFLGAQLTQPDALVLVAASGDEIVGYAYAGIEGHDWMALRGPAGVVHDLVVAPARRGQGVGRQLLEATIRALEGRGAPRIVLWTAEHNTAAHGLFARVGFRTTMREMTREAARSSQPDGERPRRMRDRGPD